MTDTIMAAIIGAIGALFVAWVTTRRQSERKVDIATNVYLEIFGVLYQVRHDFVTIRHLLVDIDPAPSFVENIVSAGKGFVDTCEELRTLADRNRLIISKSSFKQISELIDVASGLVDGLNRGMSGLQTPSQTQHELSGLLRDFDECLEKTEAFRREWCRL